MTKRKFAYGITFLVLCTALISFVIYAAFTFNTDFKGDSNHLDIGTNTEQITFGSTSSSEDFTFDAAGSYYEKTFTAGNTSNSLLSYNFYLGRIGTEEERNRLESSTLVYFNDEFKGTLSNLLTVTNRENYLLDSPLILISRTQEVKIRLQLHNAVQIEEYTNRSISIRLHCEVSTVDTKTYSVVSTESEFQNVVTTINNNSDIYKEIVLKNEITLSNVYTISNPCKINLNGFNILGAIIVADTVDIVSCTTALVTGITLNSDNAFLWLDENSTSTVTVTSFSMDKLIAKGKERLENKNISTEFTLFENNIYYNDQITITAGNGYTYSSGGITPSTTLTKTIVTTITLDSTTFEFKIVPFNDYETNILAELAHISYYDMNTQASAPEVTFDLFLPTNIKTYNAIITWYSSNEEIMNSKGLTTNAGTGEVELTARIEYNGNAFTHIFKISVLKQNNEMRFQYLLAKIGTVIFTGIYSTSNPTDPSTSKQLPSLENYITLLELTEDLGVESIEYNLEGAYYYLSLGLEPGYLVLQQVTFDKLALLGITVTFVDEPNADEDGNKASYSGNINIEIDLHDNNEYIQSILDYVESTISPVDVLQNMLDTREEFGILNEKGDFLLIDEYLGFQISYISTSECYSIGKAIECNGQILDIQTTDTSLNYIIYNGESIYEDNGYIPISTKYMISNITNLDGSITKRVTIDGTNYTSTYGVTIDNVHYLGTADSILIGDVEYTVTDGRMEYNGITYVVENIYFLIDGAIYKADNNEIEVTVNYKIQPSVKINPEKLNSTVTLCDITVRLSVGTIDNVVTTGTGTNSPSPTFEVPAAIHQEEFGTQHTILYQSIKYQTLLQNDINLDGVSIEDTKDYILVHDIQNCEVLVLKYGTNTTRIDASDISDLVAVLDWATGSSTTTQPLFTDVRYNWIQSDGSEGISDQEQYAILKFFEEIPYFTQLLNEYLYTKNGKTIKDNELSEIEANQLKAIRTDLAYTRLINWATSVGTSTARIALEGVTWTTGITNNLLEDVGTYSILDTVNDSQTTISVEEEMVILRYVWSKGYGNFYSIWNGIITKPDALLTNNSFSNSKNDSFSNSKNDIEYVLNDLPLKVFDTLISWARFTPENATESGSYNNRPTLTKNLVEYFIAERYSESAVSIIMGLFGLNVEYTTTSEAQSEGHPIDTIPTGDTIKYSETENWYTRARGLSWSGTVYNTSDTFVPREAMVIKQFITYNFDSSWDWDDVRIAATTISAGTGSASKYYIATATTNNATDNTDTYFANLKSTIASYMGLTITSGGAQTTESFASTQAKLDSVISWATSTSSQYQRLTIAISNYGNLQYNINDGLATISTEEYAVIEYLLLNEYYKTTTNATDTTSETLRKQYIQRMLPSILNVSGNRLLSAQNQSALINSLAMNGNIFDDIIAAATSYNPNDAQHGQFSKSFNFDFTYADNQVTIDGITYTIRDGNLYTSDNEAPSFNYLIESTFVRVIYEYTFDGLPTISYAEYEILKNLIGSSDDYKLALDEYINLNLKDSSGALIFDECMLSDRTAFESAIQDVFPATFYFEVPEISNNCAWLSFYINLVEFYASGSSDVPLFTTDTYANAVFLGLANNNRNISVIEMAYTGLSDISSAGNFNQLSYLDLKGNSKITSIDALGSLNNGYLSYLNICGATIETIAFSLPYIDHIYEAYNNPNQTEIKYADLRYSDTYIEDLESVKVDVFYSPDNAATDAMLYCFLLKEIGEITGQRLMVTNSVYADGQKWSIIWNVVDGTDKIEYVTSGEFGVFSLKSIESSVDSNMVVLSASITANASTYTRYFLVELSSLSSSTTTS